MLKEETASDGHTAGNNNWSRAANSHERVWVCEACENAPATFLCKADAASLCAACDAAIHTANPLARRHQRVPILPISDGRIIEDLFGEEEIEDETDSWLLVSDPKKDNHNKGNQNQNQSNNGNGLLFGGEVGEYLDLEEYNANQFIDDNRNYEFMNHGGESVVPVDCEEEGGKDHQYNDFQLGFDFECSKSGFNFNVSSNHGVGVSSEVPNSYNGRAAKGTIDLFTSTSTGEEMRDREARVMRYREKKKNRKFEKTIRYASRKAYAETRPRIKGRFAKRTTQHMFAQPAPYGVVPSAF